MRCLPAGEHAAGHVLGEQRVGEVVAPVAVDVEVAAQQALAAEAQPLDQPLAGPVLGPDVGLHAGAGPTAPKAWSQTSATASEAMPRPATDAVDPVAEVPRAQRAPDDVVDRHLPGQPALDADGERQRGAQPRAPRRRRGASPGRPAGVCRSRHGSACEGSHGLSQSSLATPQPAPLGGVPPAERVQLHRSPAPAAPASRGAAAAIQAQPPSSSGMTVTSPPAATSVTSSSMTIRQLARAMRASSASVPSPTGSTT